MASKFDSSKLYTCENCGKSFQTNTSLKDHEIFAIKYINQISNSSITKVQYTLKILSLVMNVPQSFPLLVIWEDTLRPFMKKNLLTSQS